MKQPKYVRIEVPRLHENIKTMNGKSSKKLTQCIDKLSELLDENKEVQHETTKEPDTLRNTGTE